MSLDGKPFDQLTHEDILALIPDVAEGRRLDYKKALPEDTEKGVRSFLNDVCALANGAGGWLIYGVDEEREDDSKTGVPSAVCGVSEVNEDEAIRDWQQRITQAVEPRLIGHRVGFINGFEDGMKVMVVYVPKSLFAPHRTNYKGVKEFYVRHDRCNLPMDIGEIRHAFVDARQIPERLDEFRRLRVSQILAGETPFPLLDGFVTILHLIPLTSLTVDAPEYDTVNIEGVGAMNILDTSVYHNRLNFDGRLYHGDAAYTATRSYMQVFRNGVIEMASSDARMEAELEGGGRVIASQDFERGVIQAVGNGLGVQTALGVQPPVYACLSLARAKGMLLARPNRMLGVHGLRGIPPIDRDVLIVPPATADTMTDLAEVLIKPALDVLWQASGLEGSPYYNQDGVWAPQARW